MAHVQIIFGNRAFTPSGSCKLPLLFLLIAFGHQFLELELSRRHFVGQADRLVNDSLLDGCNGLVQLVEFISDFRNGSDRVVLIMFLIMFGQVLLAAAIFERSVGGTASFPARNFSRSLS